MSIWTHRHHARVTLEFITPFHIGAGREDVSDALVVRDANGLPAIPGSSLAGVLRAQLPEEQGNALFGFQKKSDGEGSRLSVSWGHLHNQKNQPVEGLMAEDELRKDPVLLNAMHPSVRDHVRLDHRGVAANTGKFDEEVLPAGHRFTFSMELLDDGGGAKDWQHLLSLLSSPGFRLGGKTRRGFGAIRVVSLLSRSYDLRLPEERRDWLALSPRLDLQPQGFRHVEPRAASDTGHRRYTLRLRPRDFWMFGGGVDPDPDRDSDNAPVREHHLRWDKNQQGALEEVFVIPGSAVKGCIAHRTAFHYHRRAGIWAGADRTENSAELESLFGSEGARNEANESQGMRRGRVMIDDLAIPCRGKEIPKPQLVHHVAIDAFTGGARDSLLFDELPLYQGPELLWEIAIEAPEDVAAADEKLLPAFEEALTDLCEGRLAMGAGRGKGFFTGKFERLGDPNHV